ncbi:MAG TPA: phospholipase D-like domain-containing protein [Kofleriaceae bacterium]|jgi:cardiolipin synthase
MATNNGSMRRESFVEVIDQRHEKLPPAWLATNKPATARTERGREVHESGRDRAVASAVVSLLQLATGKAVVSSFLLADKGIEDALLAAARSGIRVYVLLASEARLGREESEGEFDNKVLEQHKAMLMRLGGHVLFRSAPLFHAKLVVVDPDTRPAGMLLTANLTSEALERNEELAVALTSQEVADATAYAKWAMWESAEHELVDPTDRFKAVRPLGKVAHPPSSTSIAATTATTTSLRDEALRLINRARSRIVVSSFGRDAEHEVVRRLCTRAREGVDVTVLARVRPASMAALLALAESGANVLGFKWLHGKAIWIDAEEALVMSANLQSDGLDHGFELGVRLIGDRASEVLGRLTGWAGSAEWRLVVAPTLGEAVGKVKLRHRDRLVEDEVKPSIDVDLGTVTASSAQDLVAQRPTVPAVGSLPRLAHELRCTWTVIVPTLDEMAPR